MQIILFLSLFLTSLFTLEAVPQEESEQIVVRLSTESQLLPIYLAKFVDDNSGFDPEYLKRLETVLQFDLNHNGVTCTVPQTPQREQMANKMAVDGLKPDKSWIAMNVFYVVQVHASNDKRLSAKLFAVNGDSVRSIDGIILTGDIKKDRRSIHQLADAIHKALFGKDGIATTHILYTIRKQVGTNKWISEIWEADYDGENAHPLIKDNNYNISPVYIPPETGYKSGGFFYVAYKNAQPKIYASPLKDPSGVRLSYLQGNQLMPTLSRQRDRVAFISDVTGNPDLFVQSFNLKNGATGKPQQIFSAKKASQGSPTFSPDGTQVAFVSNKDGSPKIYLIDIPSPGTPLKDIKAQLITKHSKESSAPAWSPDGTKLAFCASTSGTRQIWVYDFTTQEERQLTQGANNKENPTWAPNSLSLIYNSSDAGACELYLVNLNQPNATKITSGPGEKRFPNWEPR